MDTHAENGGAACTGLSSEQQDCSTDACPAGKFSIIFLLNCCKGIKLVKLPAGHASVLQSCCSEERPAHTAPPLSACVSTFRVLICTPPPQVLLQVDHASYAPHTQSTEVFI